LIIYWGYLYSEVPKNAPLGKTFEGLSNIDFTNPVPNDATNQPPDGSGNVADHMHDVSAAHAAHEAYFMPFPDPSEEYWHVNLQLFDKPDGGEIDFLELLWIGD